MTERAVEGKNTSGPALASRVVLWLVLVHLAVAAITFTTFSRGAYQPWKPGWIYGMAAAQATLLGAWAALGRGGLARRVAPTLLLLGVVVLLLVALPRGRGSVMLLIIFGGAMALQYLAIFLPSLAIRLVRAWCIAARGSVPSRTSREESQFGLGALLAWFTAVAVLLAIGRSLIPPRDEIPPGALDARLFGTVVAIVVSSAQIGFVAVWIVLAASRWWFLRLAGAVGLCSLVTFVECEVVVSLFGAGRDTYWIAIMNGVHFGWLFATLGVLRCCGWRLVREAGAQDA